MHKLTTIFCILAFSVGCDDSAMNDSGEGYYGYEAPPQQAPQSQNQPIDEEQERKVGENEFVDTGEDHYATFSVDTDTASYTWTRGQINNGKLPDAEMVRTEEFINYFKYNEGTYTEGAPFKVHTESAPSPFGEGLQMLRVNLKGRDVPLDAQGPTNLVFLVDVSGSMSGAKLELVKDTLIELTRVLDAEDTIAIVTYAGGQRIVLEPTPVSEEREISSAIDALLSGGGTNGAAGISTAYELAKSAYREQGNNRVILCTDGDFNVGLTGDSLVALVASWRDRGVMLSVLGVGDDLNDAFLEELTNQADGTYHFLDSADEARRVVVALASGILEVLAKEVKIQVDLNPEVVARYRLVGYENRDIADDDFRDDTVDAGEVSSSHQVTAFIELELHEMSAERSAEPLATVRVRYKAPNAVTEDPAVEIEHTHAINEGALHLEGTSPAFRFGVAVVEFAEVLRGSMHVSTPDLSRVREIAEGATEGLGDREELLGLVSSAQSLMR